MEGGWNYLINCLTSEPHVCRHSPREAASALKSCYTFPAFFPPKCPTLGPASHVRQHTSSVSTGQPETCVFHPHFEKQFSVVFFSLLVSRSKGHPSIHRFVHTEKRMKCLLPIKFCARLQGLQQQNNNNNNNDDDNNNKIINRTGNEMGPPSSKT